MPQDRNSNRRASLDDKKERAAGRQKNPLQGREKDFGGGTGRTGQVSGAFGADNPSKKASRRGGSVSKGGGGGGGSFSIPKD